MLELGCDILSLKNDRGLHDVRFEHIADQIGTEWDN